VARGRLPSSRRLSSTRVITDYCLRHSFGPRIADHQGVQPAHTRHQGSVAAGSGGSGQEAVQGRSSLRSLTGAVGAGSLMTRCAFRCWLCAGDGDLPGHSGQLLRVGAGPDLQCLDERSQLLAGTEGTESGDVGDRVVGQLQPTWFPGLDVDGGTPATAKHRSATQPTNADASATPPPAPTASHPPSPASDHNRSPSRNPVPANLEDPQKPARDPVHPLAL